MNWFTHMKVGSKLVLGFFAVSLIGAVIGVLGVVKTSELSDLATLMYEREMLGAQRIAEAKETLHNPVRRMLGVSCP